MSESRLYVELPPFTGRNVPITEIAKAMKKDAQYVRIGLQKGILTFGYAIKLDDSNESTTTVLTARYGRRSAISVRQRLQPKRKSLSLAGNAFCVLH
ncbi:MAG: hypothetical protein LUD78_01750 [Clostridiales bacterium]|nr:hypothetical protein [Clostridiales bacterium]